jgi:hypothetical protein
LCRTRGANKNCTARQPRPQGARLYSASGNKFLPLRGRGIVLGYGDRALALPEKI